MSLLEVRRLSHRYGHGQAAVTALDDVSLCLDQGLLLGVLGPSGSGKTTLLSIIAGLLTPTSGEVILDGQAVHLHTARKAARFRRQNIGIVFQEYHLIPYLTARDNLLLVPHLRGRTTQKDRARADDLLGEFDLGARARHKPAELSGGERQRVAIARAFMNEPKVMLVDEPTSHLDTERGRQVLELLRDHIHGRAMTCVMVTHDQRMTDQADQTVRLVDGKVQG